MNITVSCPSCDTSFPVDTTKIPSEGVRAQCSVCPEIFDVDRSNGVATEAPPAPEPMVDAIESADPLESEAVDLPPIEGGFEGDGPLIEAEPSADAFAQIQTEPEEVVAADVSSEPEPAGSDDAAAAGADAESPGPIRFGRRSPADKAKSLARSLVSDLIAYNPEKHKEAVAGGNLQEVFGEEIEKSLKEYQEQVEPDVIAEGSFFNDALNSILAEGQDIFSLDN